MDNFRRRILNNKISYGSTLTAVPLIGDYLKDDLVTVVPSSSVTGPDPTIVGMYIGLNDVTGRRIFISFPCSMSAGGSGLFADTLSHNNTFIYETPEYDLIRGTYSNGVPGKVATFDNSYMNTDTPTLMYDLGGMENTKTLITVAYLEFSNNMNTYFPFLYAYLQFIGMSALEFIENKDTYDGWFIPSTGVAYKIKSAWELYDDGTNKYMYNKYKLPTGENFGETQAWCSMFANTYIYHTFFRIQDRSKYTNSPVMTYYCDTEKEMVLAIERDDPESN